MKKNKKIFVFFALLIATITVNCQVISNQQKKDLMTKYDKQIKTISTISSDNVDMLPVYNYQISNAELFLKDNEKYNTDNELFAKYIELKSVLSHNKDLITFITPRVSDMYYCKAMSALSNNKKTDAYTYLQKSVSAQKDNIMANYELSKISLDSGQIVKTTTRLTNILSTMKPNEEQKLLCQNLIAYSYDKNLLKSMAFIKEGKYAYAYDILNELNAYCEKDIYGICNKNLVNKNLKQCQQGIYDNHIDVTKRAIDMGQMNVAGDFVVNTYDYFQRNRQAISDTASFDNVVNTVVSSYLNQAKQINEAKNNEARVDLLRKAKDLAAMVGGKFEENTLRQIALLQGTSLPSDTKLDSIENNSKNNGYTIDYANYIKDTISDAQENVSKIEKDYIASSDNKTPKKSVEVAINSVNTIDKAVDDKFFETRSFLKVNNYEKALEVLEKANRLAKMEGDKKEVDKMYIKAIREITAKRMSQAEYAIFQGDVKKADSLVAKTDDLIKAYKMEKDTAIVNIMNSYLRAIDDKVCQKKQEEINVMVYDILESIRKNDFYTADAYITKAMQIKGSNECRLDKSRVRSLKRQIEEPLEYVKMKEDAMSLLANGDTTKFFIKYSELERFYNVHKLNEMSVVHQPLRDIMTATGNDNLAIKTTEDLIKYKQYEGAVESLGALKNFGYKARHTKKVQKRLGQMMSLEDMKRQDKIDESYRITDKYANDKWFKYFLKSYKKNLIKWQKQEE
ncbi:MAG: hypothetical protein LKE30_07315 [Bacteroidales bacterium]|nr:hypothetical protein [Bacteroidales bacterium]